MIAELTVQGEMDDTRHGKLLWEARDMIDNLRRENKALSDYVLVKLAAKEVIGNLQKEKAELEQEIKDIQHGFDIQADTTAKLYREKAELIEDAEKLDDLFSRFINNFDVAPEEISSVRNEHNKLMQKMEVGE